MQYNFSAEFLKILGPDTSFGDAWESLCYDLLLAETGDLSLQRLLPPDRGIDIWHRATESAYQCKSHECGAFGSLSANDSIDSLRAAVSTRTTLNWTDYLYATNANYTGSAFEKILTEGNALGVESSHIQVRGPEYWSTLCERHYEKVTSRLDYRIQVSENQVIEAFRKAKYYDEYVNKFEKAMMDSPIVLKIKNNRTPIVLEIPFSLDLKVENCVDAIQELLDVSLKWTNFSDLGTSAGPSIALTVNRRSQTFAQTIGEVVSRNGSEDLEFWITIRWIDKCKEDGTEAKEVYSKLMAYRLMECYIPHSDQVIERYTLDYTGQQQKTIERAEELIQTSIWSAATGLKKQPAL